ncbi:hypothetical protein STZ1_11065 [Bacillus subtilis]
MDKDYILVAGTNGKTGNNTTCSTPFSVSNIILIYTLFR